MSPENVRKHEILYGGFNTRRCTLVHGFCFFKLFPIWCIGLTCIDAKATKTGSAFIGLSLEKDGVCGVRVRNLAVKSSASTPPVMACLLIATNTVFVVVLHFVGRSPHLLWQERA